MMFSKRIGTLVNSTSSFSVVSAIEKMKWILFWFSLVYVALAVSILELSTNDIVRLILAILLSFAAFSYQRRWTFDASIKQFTQFHGFKLGSNAIYVFQQVDVDYSLISNVELKEVHNTYKLILHTKGSVQTLTESTFSISLKVPPHKLSALAQQLRKIVLSHGINIIGGFDDINRKDWPEFSTVTLDQDTVKAFVRLDLFNDPVKFQFPVRLFMLPLPNQHFHRVWGTSYVGFLVASLILFSSQNIVAAIVVVLFGLAASAVRRKLICDEHYGKRVSAPNEIVISEHRLVIPSVFFEDKQARQLEKPEISAIDIEWNWYKTSDNLYDATFSARRRPFVFRVTIELQDGESLELAGQAFDSNKFAISLYKLGYKATLTQIPQLPAVWRFYLFIPLAICLLGMTGYGLYSFCIRFLL